MPKYYRYLIFPALVGAAMVPLPALAHCPLCTAGAGLVALGAYSIGVKAIVIGVALGALATAMGLWFARIIKRKIVPRQDTIIAVLVWLLTLIPIRMLFGDYVSWYVNWSGDYGSLFNRTYAVNLFLVGAVVGTITLAAGPAASRALTKLRGGRKIPFQGMIVSLGLTILAAVILQFL